MSEAGEANLQSITSGLMYSRVPHIVIFTCICNCICIYVYCHLHLAVVRILQVFRQPKVDDPEVVVVVRVGEHDVEGLEVEVEDALAVDELDSPHNLSDEDLAFPLCQAVVVGGRSGDHVLIVQGWHRVAT